MKRTISLLLTVIMCLSLFVINTNAIEISQTTSDTIEPLIPIEPPIEDDVDADAGILPKEITDAYVNVKNLKGYFHIKNNNTGMYVDIHGPNTDMIHQWVYHTGFQEIWEIIPFDASGEVYVIKSLLSGKFLGIENTNTGENNVKQYSVSASDMMKPLSMINKFWCIRKNRNTVNDYVLEPFLASGKMLVAADSICGSELQLTDTLAATKSKWSLIQHDLKYNYDGNIVYNYSAYIQNAETRRFSAPYGGYTNEGNTIHQWEFSTQDCFMWEFQYNTSDLSYTIKNKYTQKYLGVSSETDASGNYYIEQYTSNTNTNTRWRLYKTLSGNTMFVPIEYALYTYVLSVDPEYNEYGSYLKLVPYSNNYEYKDEWKKIDDYPYYGSIDNYWYSDDDVVGYWENNVITVYCGLDTLDYPNQLSNALSQWGNALGVTFSMVSSSENANIRIYTGTNEQLASLGNMTIDDITWGGLTNWQYAKEYIVSLSNGNDMRYVARCIQSTIYISSELSEDITNVFIHEMGHALGYFGHPTEEGNIMQTPSGITTLTYAEKRHLQEIYENFAD